MTIFLLGYQLLESSDLSLPASLSLSARCVISASKCRASESTRSELGLVKAGELQDTEALRGGRAEMPGPDGTDVAR